MSLASVGLRILTSDSNSTSGFVSASSNVVINYGVKSIKPIFEMNQRSSSDSSYLEPDPHCFLKTCFLCCKILRLDEDVYMYGGDKGFCSEACRNRQIFMDEKTEVQRWARQTLASFCCCRKSCNFCQQDTDKPLEEFRHRRRLREQPISSQMDRTPASIFTF